VSEHLRSAERPGEQPWAVLVGRLRIDAGAGVDQHTGSVQMIACDGDQQRSSSGCVEWVDRRSGRDELAQRSDVSPLSRLQHCLRWWQLLAMPCARHNEHQCRKQRRQSHPRHPQSPCGTPASLASGPNRMRATPARLSER
jgi:hypothetical protein